MSNVRIPLKFINTHTELGWGEALWAINRGFINTKDIYDIAKNKLNNDSEDWREIEILNTWKNDSESLFKIIHELADEDQSSNFNEFEDKWIFYLVKHRYQSMSFDDFYSLLFDFYFENHKPEFLKTLLNFKSTDSPNLANHRNETKKIIEAFIKKNDNQ